MRNYIKLLLVLTITFSACNQEDVIPIDPNDMIIGSWIAPEYASNDSTYSISYKRASALQGNKPGISFLANAVYVNRNSGWCGTPPLSYFDYQGTWSQNKSTISLSMEQYSPDQDKDRWNIVLLDDNNLTLEKIKE